jgi:hypothetical protein
MFFHYKYLGGNQYDVFLENGWENWGRIAIDKHRCHYVNGLHLPLSVLKAVHSHIMGK